MHDNESPGLATKWGPIRLQEGIRASQMTAFFIAAVVIMMLITFVPQAQPLVLKELLHVPAAEQGSVTGLLGLVATIVGLLLPSLWGSLSDKAGRRMVFTVGFLIAAGGIVLYPLASGLLLLYAFRITFATGTTALNTMQGSLLGDYIDERDRGKANGIIASGSGLGAIVTVFLFLSLPRMFQEGGLAPKASILWTFRIVAGMGFLAACIVFLGLRKGRVSKDPGRIGFFRLVREGFLQARRDPLIALAYGTSFAATGAITVIGTFLSLWIVDYGTAHGMSGAEALSRGGMMIGVSQVMGLVTAPFAGILSDKLGKVKAVVVAALFTALSYGATLLVPNPLAPGFIVFAVFLGISQISGIVTSGALAAKQAPEEVRGAVMGLCQVFGALGAMLIAILGGRLFDLWLPQAPFAIAAVICAGVGLWGITAELRSGKGRARA